MFSEKKWDYPNLQVYVDPKLEHFAIHDACPCLREESVVLAPLGQIEQQDTTSRIVESMLLDTKRKAPDASNRTRAGRKVGNVSLKADKTSGQVELGLPY